MGSSWVTPSSYRNAHNPNNHDSNPCDDCIKEGRDKNWLGLSKCGSCPYNRSSDSSYNDWMG